MDNIVTSDLTKFGFRELDMAGDLLKAYAENGSDFLTDGVNVFMNTNSGNVFLADEDMNVGMMRDGKLEQFFCCPNCGNEGFDDDKENGAYKFKVWDGYCSRKCKNS